MWKICSSIRFFLLLPFLVSQVTAECKQPINHKYKAIFYSVEDTLRSAMSTSNLHYDFVLIITRTAGIIVIHHCHFPSVCLAMQWHIWWKLSRTPKKEKAIQNNWRDNFCLRSLIFWECVKKLSIQLHEVSTSLRDVSYFVHRQPVASCNIMQSQWQTVHH